MDADRTAWSPLTAYVFGYWLADGNMHYQAGSGGYLVSIGSADVAHLALLRDLLGVGRIQPIVGSPVAKLVISRKAFYAALLRLGGSERKSLTLQWPAVPPEHLAHLVRGYIDGDGSLSWHRTGRSVQPHIGVLGTHHFVSGLVNSVAAATGIPAPRLHEHTQSSGNTWTAKWYGMAAKCLAIWLYRMHPGPALARKAALAEAFVPWQPKVVRRNRITPRMRDLFAGYLPE
jgi:hypothetical protein